MGGSPISLLSLFSYNVPPSVQILRRVSTVALGADEDQAFSSNSRNSSRGVYVTVHLSPV